MSRWGLFDVFGIELEYMIVDGTLEVLPVADRILAAAAGEIAEEVELGPLAWSNELALHVIELKTNGPVLDPARAGEDFQAGVRQVNRLLEPLGGRLLPAGMHPWMDPARDMRLWPHGSGEIYEAYDRIFGCRGHGWANLQSAHLNLPFADDWEFARLHSAVRLILPLLPALSASSPVMEGRITGLLDTRLDVYRRNQERIPEIAGEIIPEAIFSRSAYEEEILQPMYRRIAPLDPEGILQHEWLNSRGAIPRFDRGAIEIRLLDVQECPEADLAVISLLVQVLRGLTGGRWTDPVLHGNFPTPPLAELFRAAVREGERAIVADGNLLSLFGRSAGRPTAGELWTELAAELMPEIPSHLEVILKEGTLARRLLRKLGPEPGRERLRGVYGELVRCLAQGEMFHG